MFRPFASLSFGPVLALLCILFSAPRAHATAVASCGTCGGSDRTEISFRAAADVKIGGGVAIAFSGLTMSATATSAGSLSTNTGLAIVPPETVAAGTITVTDPTDSCGFSGAISADFVPSGGCGIKVEIRTKDPTAATYGPWSANLHPTWTQLYVGTAPIVIDCQLRILRADSGAASAPAAATDTTPPTISKTATGWQTDPAAFTSRLPLGATAATGGINAGSLVLGGPLAPGLASRANLVLRDPLGAMSTVTAPATILRQAKSATRLADVTDIVEGSNIVGFEIRVFEAGDYAATPGQDGLYPINAGAQPSITHRYLAEPAATGHLGGVRVETIPRQGPAETNTYKNTTTTEHTVTTAGGLQTTTLTSSLQETGGIWHRTDVETVARDGVPYRKTERDFILQSVPDSGANASVTPFLTAERRYTDATTSLETTWTPGPFPGLPATITRPDGSWEKHIYYDGSGADGGQPSWIRLPKQTITPWNDTPASPPASGTDGCQVVTLTYMPVDGTLRAAGRTSTLPPSQRVTATPPDPAALITLLAAAGLDAAWQPQAADLAALTLADVAGSEQIPSTTISYLTHPAFGLTDPPLVPWAGRTFATLDAEGDGALTGYEPGTFDASSGTFTVVTPADLATHTHIRAITLDLRHSALPADGEKVKHITIEDLHGRTVREELHLHDGTAWSSATVTTTTYDDAPANALRTVTTRQDDRITREFTELSPTQSVHIDEQGIKTTSTTDALGRTTKVVIEGCGDQPDRTITNIHVGRTTTTVESAGTLSLTTSTTTSDLAGRTASTTDAAGATTTTEYPNNGRDTLLTLPGSNTHLTTRTRDGLTVSLTGTAAVHEYHSHAISDGNLVTTRRSGAETSPRLTTTTTDAAGRTVFTAFPSPAADGTTITHTTHYAPNTRRAVSLTTSAPGTAATLSVRPDPASSLTRTGPDADADNTLTPASDDRITETRHHYLKQDGLWWSVTDTRTYDTEDSATSFIATSTRQRLHAHTGGTASATKQILPGGGVLLTTTAIDRTAKTLTTTTTRTDCTLPQTTVHTNGLPVSETTHQSATPTRRIFDPLGRPIVETNPLGAVTRTAWNASGQIESVTDQFHHTTRYSYWEPDTTAAGRLKTTTNALGKTTTHTWSPRGELLTTTGTAAYPVTRAYDIHGALETLTTFRDPATDPDGDTTTWQRHSASGALHKKIDPDTHATTYSWYPNGKAHTRQWQRGPLTTWTWTPLGDLTAITHTADGDLTPDVTITAHTRLGQPRTITQTGIGTETRTYHPGRGTPATQSYSANHAILPGKAITWPAPDPYGQPAGYTPSDAPAVAYAWEESLLETITTGTRTHTYTYRTGTGWVESVSTPGFIQTHTRDIAGRLIATASAVPGTTPTPITRHGYRLDDLDRRTRATQLDGSTWNYGYNDRSEVKSAIRKDPHGAEIPALAATYQYDLIGNRLTSTSAILGDSTYTPNSANQYSAIVTNNARTVLGTAPANAPVTVNNAPAARTGTLFHKPLTADNSAAPAYLTAAISDGTTTHTRHIWLPQATTAPVHDTDGNLTNDGQWSYIWDGDNRLVRMETTLDAVAAGRPYRKLVFAYDWTGRRLSRIITDTNNTILSDTRWLYDGWNPVNEYSGQTLSKTYLWGMDMSGTLQGAGGVGGLLSVHIPNPQSSIYYPSFDGNGNITAWTASGTTAPVCRREYDAFGNIVIEQGAPPCSLGFSTKLEDPETGLLYYGHRYYNPPLGRWHSKDPIEEQGGLNLYGFVGNDGVDWVDMLGMLEAKDEESKQRLASLAKTTAGAALIAEVKKLEAAFPEKLKDADKQASDAFDQYGSAKPATPEQGQVFKTKSEYWLKRMLDVGDVKLAFARNGNQVTISMEESGRGGLFEGETFHIHLDKGSFFCKVDLFLDDDRSSRIGGLEVSSAEVLMHELVHARDRLLYATLDDYGKWGRVWDTARRAIRLEVSAVNGTNSLHEEVGIPNRKEYEFQPHDRELAKNTGRWVPTNERSKLWKDKNGNWHFPRSK